MRKVRQILQKRLTRVQAIFIVVLLAGSAVALTITTLLPEKKTFYDFSFEESDFVLLNMTTTFSSTPGNNGAVQFGRPNSTIDSGAFSVVGATTHHEAIDEVVPNDDTDYAVTSTSGDELIVSIDTVDPEGAMGDHTMRFMAKAFGAGGPERMQIVFYQGVTEIASSEVFALDRTTYEVYGNALSQSEVDQITDYSNLRLGLRIVALGSGESIRVTQAELELPGPPETPLDTITIDIVLKNMNSTSTHTANVTVKLLNITLVVIASDTKQTGSVASRDTVSLTYIFTQEGLLEEFYSDTIIVDQTS